MADLALVGDVMLGRRVADVLEEEPPEYPWGDTRPRLREADATLGNLECVLASGGDPARKRFTFRCPPWGADVLEAGGFDLVTLANNHTLDFGAEALEECLEALDEAGIAHAGAGPDEAAAWQPATVEAGDLRVGVLSITDNARRWAAGPSHPGTAWVPVDPDRDAYQELKGRVSRLRPSVDLLVVGAHWGPNDRRHPPEEFQAFARGLLEAGVDLFWGHSAHIFQGVERRDDGVIVYDAGDFVDDYRVDDETRNDLGFLVEVQAGEREVGPVTLTPTHIDPTVCQVNLADGDDAEWALETMERLCAGFDTEAERVDGALRV